MINISPGNLIYTFLVTNNKSVAINIEQRIDDPLHKNVSTYRWKELEMTPMATEAGHAIIFQTKTYTFFEIVKPQHVINKRASMIISKKMDQDIAPLNLTAAYSYHSRHHIEKKQEAHIFWDALKRHDTLQNGQDRFSIKCILEKSAETIPPMILLQGVAEDDTFTITSCHKYLDSLIPYWIS